MNPIELEATLPIPQALDILTVHLKKEGFGILTTINLSATLQEKLGVEIADTLILGACNPNFAYEALGIDENVSLVLPCNIVLKTVGDKTKISIGNPFDLINQPGLRDVASKAYDSLKRVVEAIQNELTATKANGHKPL